MKLPLTQGRQKRDSAHGERYEGNWRKKKRAGQKSGAGKIISAGNSEIENNCCAEHDSIPAESGKIMFFDIIHKEFYSKD